MKLLVVGCGSMGERHIRNLKSFSKGEIIACDTNRTRLSQIREKYNIKTTLNFKKAIDENHPDAAIICVPPYLHIPFALYASKQNIHCFIEKPLSHSLKGIDKLINLADKKKLIIYIGYNWRFHPGFKLVKKILEEDKIGHTLSATAEFGQYLPDWRPWQDYRQTYTAKKDMGGGILLDASHEIDYLRWFFWRSKRSFLLC